MLYDYSFISIFTASDKRSRLKRLSLTKLAAAFISSSHTDSCGRCRYTSSYNQSLLDIVALIVTNKQLPNVPRLILTLSSPHLSKYFVPKVREAVCGLFVPSGDLSCFLRAAAGQTFNLSLLMNDVEEELGEQRRSTGHSRHGWKVLPRILGLVLLLLIHLPNIPTLSTFRVWVGSLCCRSCSTCSVSWWEF